MQPRRQSTPVEGLPLFPSFRVLDVEIDGLCHSPSRPGEQIIREWVFVDRLLELLGTGRCQNGKDRSQVASLEVGRNGGGRRPGDGFPPPSQKGLVRKPDWTMMGHLPLS